MIKKTAYCLLTLAMAGTVLWSCKDVETGDIYPASGVSYWLGTAMTQPTTEIIDGEEYECSGEYGDGIALLRIKEGKDLMYKKVGVGYYDYYSGELNLEEAAMKSTDQTSGSINFPNSFGIGTYNFTMLEEGVMEGTAINALGEPISITFCKVACRC